MVCARSSFPYAMKNPSTLLAGDAKPLSVSLAALASGDPDVQGGWQVIDADVQEAQARSIAGAALRAWWTDPGEIVSSTTLEVRAIHFVRYPIWFARYRYRGVAAPEGDVFHVGLSAVDGAPVTARHPSKLRAGAARLKGLFGSGGTQAARATTSEGSRPEAPEGKVGDLRARFEAHVQRERGKR
jgi:hypothetical protein